MTTIHFYIAGCCVGCPPPKLVSSFPKQCIDDKTVDYFMDSAELLKLYKGSRDHLNRPRGRAHWTEISHAIFGEHLADVVSVNVVEKVKE